MIEHWSFVQLRFVDRSIPAGCVDDPVVRDAYSEGASLPDGCPVLLDGRWRPVEPWLTYFRVVSRTVGASTLRNYAYDALRFAQFLEDRGTDVVQAQQEDIVAYRESRRATASRPVAPATWQREAVVIRGVYSLLRQQGTIERDPWITLGRSSVLGRTWRKEPDIRPLSFEQWVFFRDVGLAGRTSEGALDESWRGRNPLRAVAGAELAVTTGMRVAEFSSLLDVEVPRAAGDRGASVLLGACAKFQKRRRVHVPSSTLRTIDLYRSTERRSIARASAASLWLRRHELFVLREVDAAAGILRGVVGGVEQRWRMHLLPPALRRIAVVERDGGLESIGLFLGRGGLPLSLRAWHATFESANRRIYSQGGHGMQGRHRGVTPHDLRHTFAVVLLKALTDVALAREGERRVGNLGPFTLSEHVAINPRLTVQRLLGHSDPATTMIYLRYIEDTDQLIQDAFDSWSDSAADYASLVLADRTIR